MSNNDNIQNLTKAILNVTLEIQERFPELYVLLSETPLFLSYGTRGITKPDLKQYLTSLKMQLSTFLSSEMPNGHFQVFESIKVQKPII